jgi:hypothetical protein
MGMRLIGIVMIDGDPGEGRLFQIAANVAHDIANVALKIFHLVGLLWTNDQTEVMAIVAPCPRGFFDGLRR